MENLISSKAKIGKNVQIGYGVRIYDNVEIADDTSIGDLCIVGLPVVGKNEGKPLYIGPRSIIRSHAVLYEGSTFHSRFETGHHAKTRDGIEAGANLRLGSYSSIEGEISIGDYVRVHGHVQVGRNNKIGSFVWIYAQSLFLGDPLPPSFVEEAVTVDDGVVLCVNTMVYPGVHIGKAAFISAGASVKKDVPPCSVVSGDGRVTGRVDLLIDRKSKLRHPWYAHYAAAYPEDAQERLKALLEYVKDNAKTRRDVA